MSQYTTGELAKLCGVSVRTVQYYDNRGILVPSALSEGGRRLYSEADLDRLKVICFLRSLELPIDSIKALLEEEHPETVISLLLEEQEARLRAEMAEKRERAERIAEVRRTLQRMPGLSARSIGDAAQIMENQKQLTRTRWVMVLMALPINIIEIVTIVIWAKTGLWQPFALGMAVVAAIGVWLSVYYFRRVCYLCPDCHTVFRPRFREAFFARHTPWTRKLTCIHCGHHGFCVETCGKEAPNAEN